MTMQEQVTMTQGNIHEFSKQQFASAIGYGKGNRSIAIIDDDQDFGDLAEYLGGELGLNVLHFGSLTELGSVAVLGQFDAVVLDYNLEHITGVEIAKYLEAFFPWIPAILISGDNSVSKKTDLPKCVNSFISKDCGVMNIIRAADWAITHKAS